MNFLKRVQLDNEWARLDYFEQIHLGEICKEQEEFWYSQKDKTQDLIMELKNEVGQDFQRERRLEYLKGIVMEKYQEMVALENLKKKFGKVFPFGDKLARAKRKYKSYYLELATLKVAKNEDNNFSDDIIEKCRRISIKDLVNGKLMNAGNGRWRMICPFHQEKTGSFFIFQDGSAHCFGCGIHFNNAVDFIMRHRNFDFRQAIDYLKYYT